MKYNDAESVTKDLEAQGHATVKLVSRLAEDADDPANDRTYEVSIRGPVSEDQMVMIKGIAGGFGATVEERDHGNVRIS